MNKSLVEADIGLATELFAALRTRTGDGVGITRVAYGTGEEIAHDLVRDAGRSLGLEVARDFAGNTYVTLPGRDRTRRVVIGSHMDSVPQGGNFDGAAGVVAGLAAIAGLQHARFRPALDVTVMAIRAEESCWFPASYTGSRMALGRLPADAVDRLVRSDTGRSLADHMTALGYDPGPVRRQAAYLDPASIGCYLEPHIEQGPVLAAEGFPVAIVEAITGGPRFRDGRIFGSYAHAGAAPRGYRQDAVAALGEFIVGVNELWAALADAGHYSLFTFGIIGTDPAWHTFSRVPGEARFCLDTRGIREETLVEIRAGLVRLIEAIERRHGVRFELGADSGPAIARMDETLMARLEASAERRGVAHKRMPSGAGHDAAAFAACGVPTAMLFIRNEHGSHNPAEAMDMSDFAKASDIVVDFLTGCA
jgi:N-carbamoyl-L-amino-acid hydrolase